MYFNNKANSRILQPDDFPTQPHWQIWLQDTYTLITGWENENGPEPKAYRWEVFAYLNQTNWESDLRALHAKAMDPKIQTHAKPVFVAFEAGGRTEARVTLDLVGKPPPSKNSTGRSS